VPQPAYPECDHDIAEPTGLGTPSAKGYIHVIAEPGAQGNVPPAPELGDVPREIGISEIATELESKKTCATDGDIRIAREIAVDLESEEEGTEEQCYTGGLLHIAFEDAIHDGSAAIGHHDLLEETPEHLAETILGLLHIERSRCQELGQQARRTFYGARHQLWEEAHKSKEGNPVVSGLDLATIDVDRIAQRLESVETDPDRQQDPHGRKVRLHTEGEQDIGKAIDKEIEVLEGGEQTQIDNQTKPHVGFPLGCCSRVRQCPTDEEIGEGAEDEQT